MGLRLPDADGVGRTLQTLVSLTIGGQWTGGFDAALAPQPLTGSGAVALVDLDEDGILDFAFVPTTSPYYVGVHLGSGTGGAGNGSFGPLVTIPLAQFPSGIATGDFNEDGLTDLAVATGGPLQILLGLGTGGVGNGGYGAPTAVPGSSLTCELAVADVTHDGIADIPGTNPTLGALQVFAGTGSGTVGDGGFAPSTTRPSANCHLFAVGVLREDGVENVVMFSQDGVNPALARVFRVLCPKDESSDIVIDEPVPAPGTRRPEQRSASNLPESSFRRSVTGPQTLTALLRLRRAARSLSRSSFPPRSSCRRESSISPGSGSPRSPAAASRPAATR